MTHLEQGIEVVHLGALDERGGLGALRTAAARERHEPEPRRDGGLGEVGVPVGVGAHVADGEVPDALQGVEVCEGAGAADGGEDGGEVGGGLGVVVGEAAGAVVLGAVGGGGGVGCPLDGGG